jgi:nitrite reductase/ring-hydroxylating ferredoxin subunit
MCAHHSAVFNLSQGGRCSRGSCLGTNLVQVPLLVVAGQVQIGH